MQTRLDEMERGDGVRRDLGQSRSISGEHAETVSACHLGLGLRERRLTRTTRQIGGEIAQIPLCETEGWGGVSHLCNKGTT